jgi:plastocyanin
VDSRTNKIVWKKEVPYEIQNGSGMTATAGGVLFHGQPDGQFQAYDAKTGDLLWQFQTGSAQNGPASVFEIDGEQYVAAVSDRAIWAFKLGGTVQPLPAPPAPRTESAWGGRVQSRDQVSMGGTVKDSGLEFTRETHDEYVMLPARIKVKAGTTVTFTNNGKEPHEATAQDGSWSTGVVQPGQSAKVTFAKPGSWTYQCKEHPWSYGQVVVE